MDSISSRASAAASLSSWGSSSSSQVLVDVTVCQGAGGLSVFVEM
ncbi:hypothetical protein [Streptomyces spiralis]